MTSTNNDSKGLMDIDAFRKLENEEDPFEPTPFPKDTALVGDCTNPTTGNQFKVMNLESTLLDVFMKAFPPEEVFLRESLFGAHGMCLQKQQWQPVVAIKTTAPAAASLGLWAPPVTTAPFDTSALSHSSKMGAVVTVPAPSPQRSVISPFGANQKSAAVENAVKAASTDMFPTMCENSDGGEASLESGDGRFKQFHEEKWAIRYKELILFHQKHGHSAVPHTYPPSPCLARWVKRQRRQRKLLDEDKPSTMTHERIALLDLIEFIWDSHEVAWKERMWSLDNFAKHYGHVNVPSTFKDDKPLATWVKCQRRQYKLYMEGQKSAMTPQRIQELETRGFQWSFRGKE